MRTTFKADAGVGAFFRWGLLCCLLLAAGGFLRAQGTINMTTTAVPFLRINPDARGGAMGETGIATTPDANSGLYNLAKLPFVGEHGAGANSAGAGDTAASGPWGGSINYTPWLRDIAPGMYLLQASAYHRLDDLQAVAASVRYFSLGNVPIQDFSGNLVENAQPREYSFDLGYARKLSGDFSMALAFRYIYSHLASGTIDGTSYKGGNAAAADVSLFYHRVDGNTKGFSAGLSLSNLGTRIGYTTNAADKEYLPANLGLGLGYTFVFNEQNKLQLSVDGNKLLVPATPLDSAHIQSYHNYAIPNSWVRSFNNAGYGVSGGAEYNFEELVFLRAGYYWEDRERGGLQYLTVGAGLRYDRFGLNFSWLAPTGNGTGRNPLTNTFRFGLIIN